MKTYYGLSSQLLWVKIDPSMHKSEDFLIIFDEENFKKFATQTIDILNNINSK